jgi:hypothetical protein
MDDEAKTPTPPLHDGMAVIQELGPGHLLLVRNHEVDYDPDNPPNPPAFGDPSLAYDPLTGRDFESDLRSLNGCLHVGRAEQ